MKQKKIHTKKIWKTPELTILIKRSDEEQVLNNCNTPVGCRTESGAGNPAFGNGAS